MVTVQPPSVLSITIVTVCFNAVATIETTLRSVIDQNWTNREHIVIDGGSTDGTLDVLEQYRHRCSAIVSETDSGIADAMNKGLKLAHGDYVAFIHADDFLASPDALSQAVEALERHQRPPLFGLPIEFETTTGQRKFFPPDSFERPWLKGYPHQGTLVRRDVFERYDGFDTAFQICMDYEFFLRCRRQGLHMVVDSAPVFAVMGGAGISSQLDWRSLSQRFGEERTIHMRHASGYMMQFGYLLYWALYIPFRRLRLMLLGY